MKNNIYEVARNIYGSEAANMQPIAFSYVPESKRGNAEETTQNTASRNGEKSPEPRQPDLPQPGKPERLNGMIRPVAFAAGEVARGISEAALHRGFAHFCLKAS